jgi:hypothetical protein
VFLLQQIKKGHTRENCYRLNGFPQGFKFTKSKFKTANMVSTEISEQSDQVSKLGFTQEQYQKLLALLSSTDNKDAQVNLTSVQQLHSSPSAVGNLFSQNWVIDTHATDHITGSLSNFTSYKLIKPIYVHLPNG